MEKVPIAIVGGGVIGCAIAYTFSKDNGGIFLFEKEPYLGNAQSGRNSGVVHAGIYYEKDSLKARLCVEGNRLLRAFCGQHDIPYANVGKVIVATNTDEEKTLDVYLEKALGNNVPDVKRVSEKELKQMQPNVNGTAALYVPSTGIINASGYLEALARLAAGSGVEILKETEIVAIKPGAESFELKAKRKNYEETFETSILINAAGLYSDKIARMINPNIPYNITPIRGEYCKFNQRNKPRLDTRQMCVYPVPVSYTTDGKQAKTLGVHLTPTFGFSNDNSHHLSSVVLVGPTATFVNDKTDYEGGRQPIEYFYGKIKPYFPNIKLEQLSIDYSGIRAKLKDHDDFVIERDKRYPNCIHLVGIDSPGLTASLAIAEYVKQLLKLSPKSSKIT